MQNFVSLRWKLCLWGRSAFGKKNGNADYLNLWSQLHWLHVMIHVQTKLFSEQSLSKTVMSWLIMAIACRAVSLSSVKSAAVALTSALMQSRQYLLLQLITQLWLHPSLKCGGQNMNRYNCCCSLRIPYTCSEIILRLRRKLLKTSTFASGAQKYAIFHCFRIYFQKIANFVSVNTIFVVFCVHNFAVFMRKNQLKFSPPPMTGLCICPWHLVALSSRTLVTYPLAVDPGASGF